MFTDEPDCGNGLSVLEKQLLGKCSQIEVIIPSSSNSYLSNVRFRNDCAPSEMCDFKDYAAISYLETARFLTSKMCNFLPPNRRGKNPHPLEVRNRTFECKQSHIFEVSHRNILL